MSPVDQPVEENRADAVTRGWVIPAIIGSALLMQTMNATVLSNALPTMAVALGEDPLRLNLAMSLDAAGKPAEAAEAYRAALAASGDLTDDLRASVSDRVKELEGSRNP